MNKILIGIGVANAAYEGLDCSNDSNLCTMYRESLDTKELHCVEWMDANYGTVATCQDCTLESDFTLSDSNGQP